MTTIVFHAVPGQLLRHIGTDVLIWAQYPTMPSKGESDKVSGPADVATESLASGPSTGAEADDAYEDANEFNADGQLPEALSSVTERLSKLQRRAPLAEDLLKVDRVLGHADLARRCLRQSHVGLARVHRPSCTREVGSFRHRRWNQ